MRSGLLVAVACAAAGAGAARAEDQGLRSTRGIDGHVFLPSFLVRTPFTVTSFDVGLAYGLGGATGPTYDLRGQVDGEREYSFAAMGQTFSYEYKFADWFSAGGGLLTTLYSGTDSPSVLVVGADVTIGGFVRATASRPFGPVQLALTADASYGPRLGILVIDAVQEALANGFGSASALDLSHVATLQPGASFAWTLSRAFGLQASAAYEWLHIPEQGGGSSSASAITMGAALDFDLGKVTKVPMGLLAAIHWVEPLSGGDTISQAQDYSVGGFYTARPDVVLGAELGWRKFQIRAPLASSETLAQVRATYYW